MSDNNTFGVFLRDKRIQKGIPLRELANKLNISHSYLSNIENGKKLPPSNKVLIDIARLLSLDTESKRFMFDIAAKEKEINHSDYVLPADISKYLFEIGAAQMFIREAEQQGYSNEFWNTVLQQLKNKNISQ